MVRVGFKAWGREGALASALIIDQLIIIGRIIIIIKL